MFCCEVKIHVKDYNKQICRLQLIIKVFPLECDLYGKIIENAPLLIAVTVIKNRCGYERDGSFSTERGDTWQMYDAGVASQTFCLAAYEAGLGTVIMGLFDNDKITSLLEIPEDRELVALIPVGYPDETPAATNRKAVADSFTYK